MKTNITQRNRRIPINYKAIYIRMSIGNPIRRNTTCEYFLSKLTCQSLPFDKLDIV